jgi:hypothetical protein
MPRARAPASATGRDAEVKLRSHPMQTRRRVCTKPMLAATAVRRVTINDIPNEIWDMICSFIPVEEEYIFASTCTLFYSVAARRRASRGDSQWNTWTGFLYKRIRRAPVRSTARCSQSRCIEEAARHGKIRLLKYMLGEGFAYTSDICSLAASGGHLNIVRYLHTASYLWDEATPQAAAAGGYLDVLQYAITNGCPTPASTMYTAAAAGKANIVEYLHSKGEQLNADLMVAAANSGNVETLHYLRSNNCPWDSRVTIAAASRGHLPVLKYAREHGCPWDATACTRAAESGQLKVLQFALREGIQFGGRVCYHLGRRRVRKWLRANRFKFPRGTFSGLLRFY